MKRLPPVHLLLLLLPLLTSRVHGQDTLADSTWVDASPHRVSFVAVSSGVELEVLDWGGTGEALVFLAGLSMNAHAFDDFAPRFTDRHRVIGVTRRGHGNSSWPEAGYDLDTLVRDVIAVLDSLGIARAIFAGHSFAGSEITRLASEQPGRVLALAYIDGVQDLSSIAGAMQHCPGGAEFETAAQQQFRNPRAFRRTQLRSHVDGSFGPNVSGAAIAQIAQGFVTPDYTRVRAPALSISYIPERIEEIFFGTDVPDDCVTAAQRITYMGVAAFAAGMQRGRVVALRNSQHNIHLVSPDELEASLRPWLQRVSVEW